MAIAFVAPVDDRPRFKSFTVSTANVDIATTTATIDFTTAGMTDLIAAPTSWGMCKVAVGASVPDVLAQDYEIQATATQVVITKLTPTIASAETMDYLVWARVDRGIMG